LVGALASFSLLINSTNVFCSAFVASLASLPKQVSVNSSSFSKERESRELTFFTSATLLLKVIVVWQVKPLAIALNLAEGLR
jgi:hypothetical protein